MKNQQELRTRPAPGAGTSPYLGWGFGLILMLGLCAQSSPALARGAAKGPVLKVGQKLPGFFLKTLNPKASGISRVVLKKLFQDPKTKTVLVSFFATWCAPCKKELPVLQKLWEAHEKDGLRIVLISIDKEAPAVKGLADFIEERGLSFPVVSDRLNLLARRYLGTTTALPSLFVADGGGIIQSIHQSFDDEAPKLIETEIMRGLGLPASTEKAESAPTPTPTPTPGAGAGAGAGEAAASKLEASAKKTGAKAGRKIWRQTP